MLGGRKARTHLWGLLPWEINNTFIHSIFIFINLEIDVFILIQYGLKLWNEIYGLLFYKIQIKFLLLFYDNTVTTCYMIERFCCFLQTLSTKTEMIYSEQIIRFLNLSLKEAGLGKHSKVSICKMFSLRLIQIIISGEIYYTVHFSLSEVKYTQERYIKKCWCF